MQPQRIEGLPEEHRPLLEEYNRLLSERFDYDGKKTAEEKTKYEARLKQLAQELGLM